MKAKLLPGSSVGIELVLAWLLALGGIALLDAWEMLLSALGVAAALAAMLLIRSMMHFSRTGPQLRTEILQHYFLYSIYALIRQFGWVFLISLAMSMVGIALVVSLAGMFGFHAGLGTVLMAALAANIAISTMQFCRHLLHIPGSIEASSNYRTSRFHRLWGYLTPELIRRVDHAFLVTLFLVGLGGVIFALSSPDWTRALGILLINGAVVLFALLLREEPDARPVNANQASRGQPNLLLIGSDGLRVDRLHTEPTRKLTPRLDALIDRAVWLRQCFVPCARTAPSLASLLTARWPHRHGIRDNFVALDEVDLGPSPLPTWLREHGYRTLAISDWCGSDLGKFPFGFDEVDLPEDQWNIRYLLRQGPKDIRLFLTFFTHNAFGRRFLPELHYLAGVPMTKILGRRTRQAINSCVKKTDAPFFINVFMSSTHAPFGSEYPYYTQYSDTEYSGDSKFVMSGLTEPFEVVERQGQGKAAFDFRQILDLYDGCVSAFDAEVGKILDHLQACGLADNTLVVIYSDHGMEFFERETWGQGNSVIIDEGSLIPLIIYDPRKPGRVDVERVTRSIDIAPTLLDMLDIPIPADMQGCSLVPDIEARTPAPEHPAYAETGVWFTRVPSLEDGHLHYPDLPELLEVSDKTTGTITFKPAMKTRIIEAKDRMIRTDRWKLVRQPMENGPEYKLFDIIEDPLCLRDVAANHPTVLAELGALMRGLIRDDHYAPPEASPASEPLSSDTDTAKSFATSRN